MKNKFMDIALEEAKNGVLNSEGGPFGAVIVDKKDNIVSKNQFSLKVNAKEISILNASSGYVVCYQGEEKVKRI